MDFENLATNIRRVVDIVNDVPNQFKDRCFDALLDAVIADAGPKKGVSPTRPIEAQPAKADADVPPTGQADPDFAKMPRRLTDWMTKYDISTEQLEAYVEVDAGEVYFPKPPSRAPKSTAQISWALALALESAIKTGKFETSSDAVRARVKDEACYDDANFAAIMNDNRDKFYGGPLKKGEVKRLSEAGEKKLAEQLKAAVA